MTLISVDYAAMASGHDGLVSTWGRIEAHLRDLDQVIGATTDMRSDALVAYQGLKLRWDSAAADRQVALKTLADLVAQASEQYRAVDAAMAAQFAV